MIHRFLVFSCVSACVCLLSGGAFGQQEDTKGGAEKPLDKNYVGPAGEKVIESLENNEDRELAESYEALAKKFQGSGNYKKAEE